MIRCIMKRLDEEEKKCIKELQKHDIDENVIEMFLDCKKNGIKNPIAYKDIVIDNHKKDSFRKNKKFIFIDAKKPDEADYILNYKKNNGSENRLYDCSLIWYIVENELQPDQKEIIKKHFIEGYKITEIADQMAENRNIPKKEARKKFKKAVYKRFQRTLEEIRKNYLKKIKK